jgi:hypothetical protein
LPDNRISVAPDPTRSTELGHPGLWAYAISGDLPILLLHVVGD